MSSLSWTEVGLELDWFGNEAWNIQLNIWPEKSSHIKTPILFD